MAQAPALRAGIPATVNNGGEDIVLKLPAPLEAAILLPCPAGCDIASFDIYPVVHSKPDVAGQLWYVARWVERLVRWTDGKKVVWNCIECTRIKNPKNKPTPHQVGCEVWMSIIHGSMGLLYFVHE